MSEESGSLSRRRFVTLALYNTAGLCVGSLVAYGQTDDAAPPPKTIDELLAWAKFPVILAGGLTPANVGTAVAAVRPFAVDVSSGVEARPGVKDPHAIAAFVAAAKGTRPR